MTGIRDRDGSLALVDNQDAERFLVDDLGRVTTLGFDSGVLGSSPQGSDASVAARLARIDGQVFNVKNPAYAGGAVGGGATDDTARIQAAIDACNAAGGGTVFIPKGTYLVTSLTYYSNIVFRGANKFTARLSSYPGSTSPIFQPSTATGTQFPTFIDLCLTAASNSSSVGGILLKGVNYALVFNCVLSALGGYAIKILGGTVQGDAMHNVIDGNTILNLLAAANAIQLTPDPSGGSHPDGTRITNNTGNSALGTAVKIDAPTGTGLGVDSTWCAGNNWQEFPTMYDIVSQSGNFIGDRIEVSSGAAVVTIGAGTGSYPSLNNTIQPREVAAPSGVTLTDNGINTIFGRRDESVFAVSNVNGGTVSFSADSGSHLPLNVTSNAAFTIGAPTNAYKGRVITIDVKNSSGGAMGAITWNAVFKLAGAFTNPANGFRRTISFYYDGTNWVETNRAAADI